MRGEIRNKLRVISQEETIALIRENEHGVLATINHEGKPCTVALNHVYVDGVLYFHSGLEGEMLDNIAGNPEVSYMIIGVADVIYEQFTTAFSSVVVHGQMHVVEDEEEKLSALTALVARYSNDVIPAKVITDFITNGVKCVTMLRLTPEFITGKARLTRKRPCLEY